MKKIAIVVTAVLLTALSANVLLAQAKVVVKEIVTISVNRAAVRTDVPPINIQGQTLVPVRSVFDAFAADIDWFAKEKRVFIRKDGEVIWLQIGDAHAKVNDTIIPLQVAATIYRGRTMVPLRFIAESLGATVNWNPSTQTIQITTKEKAKLVPEKPIPGTPPEGVQPPETEQPTTPPSDNDNYNNNNGNGSDNGDFQQ